MKTIQQIMILLLFGSFLSTHAQINARKGWDGVVKGGPRLNVSYNSTMPNSAIKDAFVSNSSGISGDIYIPFQLFRKGWDGTVKGGSFGFNIGGTYNFGGNDDPNVALPTPFKIFGETASSIAYLGVDARNPGFRIGGGPQANFNFGEHFTVSPMVLAEYFSMTQKELSAVQTTQVNGQTKEYNLWTLPETKTTGLAITPKVRLRYMFTQSLGVFADAGYIFGPKINTQTSTLKPLGNPNQAGQYDQQQLDLSTQVKSDVKSTSYKALALNIGLSFDFGRRRCPNGDCRDTKKVDDKGWNGATKSNDKGWNGIAEEQKFSPAIQKLIDDQDQKANQFFEKVTSSNKKTSSSCNFEVKDVEIQCNGKDKQGRKKYHIVIKYKNNSTSGSSSLGHFTAPCLAPTLPATFVEFTSTSMGTILPGTMLPNPSVLNPVAPGMSQNIEFDFIPNPGTLTLHLMGNTINSATSCGNCDDYISLNLPNCCDGCEENPLTANSISTTQLDAATGTIRIVNSISSPKNIVRVDADIVSIKYSPITNDCVKCNNKNANQDNFVGTNNLSGTGWTNSGNPKFYLGENSLPNTSRSLVFTSASTTGVNLTSPTNITHTVGVSPNSCCGDTVEIWIRYTIWDTECHVCDKLVKSTINRDGSCAGSNGGGTGTSTGTATQLPNKL